MSSFSDQLITKSAHNSDIKYDIAYHRIPFTRSLFSRTSVNRFVLVIQPTLLPSRPPREA